MTDKPKQTDAKLSETKTTLSQLKASREYRKRVNSDENKREHRNYMIGRRNARSFINTKSTEEDLQELEQLIANRRQQLNSHS